MKKLFALSLFLLVSCSSATAMKKQIVEQKESCWSIIKSSFMDTIEAHDRTLGYKEQDDSPYEEKYDMNPMKGFIAIYKAAKTLPIAIYQFASQCADEYEDDGTSITGTVLDNQ